MADDDRSDSLQSVEIPGEMLQLINGQPTEMTITGTDLDHIGIPGFQPETLNDLSTPKLQVIEQPKSRGFRFRYSCEGPSHGGLPGVNSQRGSRKKTYPSIEIINYKGAARVVVSLVTNEEVPKPHAHSLVGKNCTNGICTVQLGPNDMTASFPNLGILHVTKKDVKKVLKARLMEHRKIYQSVMGTSGDTEKEVEKSAHDAAKNMDLSVVRLCFQAYLPDGNGNFTRTLTPVISVPVYDCKAPNAATLKICRMDKSSGCAAGGDEVYLLCDKVQKDDIQVRFFEMSSEGKVTWEANADFGPTDVHRQFAIVFKTPPYRNPNIERQVYVQVQLKRRSDGDVSDPKPFTYYPKEHDREYIQRKRKKPLPHFSDHFGGGSRPFGNTGQGSSGTGIRPGGSGYPFVGTTVPGTFGFQPTPPFQQPIATVGMPQSGIQHQIMLQQNTMGQGQQQLQSQQLRMQQQQQQQHMIRQQHIQQQQQQQQPPQQQQQPPQQQPQQQQQQQQMNGGFYQAKSGTVLQPRGIGGMFPSAKDASSNGDRVVPTMKKPSYSPTGKLSEIGKLETDSAPPALPSEDSEGDLEKDSAPIDDEFVDVIGDRFNPALAKYISQETVSNVGGKLSEIELKDSEIQTDSVDLEYDSLAWRLAERTSNAMRDYAISGDIKMLLAVQRHLTAVEDDNGDSPIHLAMIHKNYDTAFALLSVVISIPKQKVVNQSNKLKQTPLHLATLTDQPRMVDLLLRCGADPNMIDGEGDTPIHIAAKEGLKDVMQALCRGPVAKAACKVIKSDLDARNLDGFTAAHLAVKNADLRNLKVLVKNGADVNVPDGKSGRTCLHHAVEKANFSILGYLITDAEADIHAANFAGDTPLHIASSLDYVAVASLLIAAGADVHCENYDFEEEWTMVEDEDQEKMEEIVKEVAVNEEERSGKTPLDLARSDRMRQTLNGLPYNPPGPVYTEKDIPISKDRKPSEICESGYRSEIQSSAADAMSNPSTVKGVTYSFEGDLHRVDNVARKNLASLLDPYTSSTDDWQGLADQLGLSNMVNNLRLLESPTMELLKHYEAMDGTVEELMAGLLELKRDDAVQALQMCTQINPVKHIGKSDGHYDSAFGESLRESMQDMTLGNFVQ